MIWVYPYPKPITLHRNLLEKCKFRLSQHYFSLDTNMNIVETHNAITFKYSISSSTYKYKTYITLRTCYGLCHTHIISFKHYLHNYEKSKINKCLIQVSSIAVSLLCRVLKLKATIKL